MPISQLALDLENRSIGIHGEPTLGAAYKILKAQWGGGDRDREIGLHLIFLSWYGFIEPGNVTGFTESDEEKRDLMQTLHDVHEYFEPRISQDAEMLYAIGVAAHMFGFMFKNPRIWEQRAERYREMYRALAPGGIDPEVFRGRGAYGVYYAAQATVAGGY